MNAVQEITYTRWETRAEWSLSSEALDKLCSNRIPAIRISQFATEAECHQLVTQAEQLGFGAYQDVTPAIERIGITVFEHDKGDKADYFRAVERANTLQQGLLSASFNPLERLMQQLHACTGRTVRIASEVPYGAYYAGLIRKIEHGTLYHIDYAPSEHPRWEVGTVTAQLVWNLYLRNSASDQGMTHIYNRQWEPADEQYKIEDSYGYDKEVVADAEHIIFQPRAGDVVLFNTRNFHIVDATDGQRVTFTSAIGLLPSGEIILWS